MSENRMRNKTVWINEEDEGVKSLMRYDADELKYEKIEIFGKKALFSDERIIPDSVPDGFFQYEVRHDDDSIGIPTEAAKRIFVNFLGTLLMEEPIPEAEEEQGYKLISDDDWNYIYERSCTLKEYLQRSDR